MGSVARVFAFPMTVRLSPGWSKAAKPQMEVIGHFSPGNASSPTTEALGGLELHLSHWRGPLAQLVINQNWAYGGFRHIFGRLTYDGVGVYGFRATPRGNPLDSYGRNVYVDTFDSAYGKGWHRENSFLSHHRGHTLGDFCYGFYPHAGHPSGDGTKYRATVEGPGVTPDVMWEGNDIGPLDQTIQDQMRSLERSWGDPKCRV